jgi:hypothetical protein
VTSVSELLNRGDSAAKIVLYDGVIASTAYSLDDEVEVTIPAFDRNLRHGPAPWMPRVDEVGSELVAVRPSRGDPCVVGFAETTAPGRPKLWVLAWRPG